MVQSWKNREESKPVGICTIGPHELDITVDIVNTEPLSVKDAPGCIRLYSGVETSV